MGLGVYLSEVFFVESLCVFSLFFGKGLRIFEGSGQKANVISASVHHGLQSTLLYRVQLASSVIHRES